MGNAQSCARRHADSQYKESFSVPNFGGVRTLIRSNATEPTDIRPLVAATVAQLTGSVTNPNLIEAGEHGERNSPSPGAVETEVTRDVEHRSEESFVRGSSGGMTALSRPVRDAGLAGRQPSGLVAVIGRLITRFTRFYPVLISGAADGSEQLERVGVPGAAPELPDPTPATSIARADGPSSAGRPASTTSVARSLRSWLPRRRVARAPGCCRSDLSTQLEWGRNGTLPRVKLGRRVHFIRAHVESAILEREQARRR